MQHLSQSARPEFPSGCRVAQVSNVDGEAANMPYANSKGVRVYYEVEGKGPPLVLAHGEGTGFSAIIANGQLTENDV